MTPNNLTKNDLLFLMCFLLILLIDSTWALYAFFRNYNLTGKLTPYVKQHSFSDLLRMHITDILTFFTIIISFYFLLFKKGLSPFFILLLLLLLAKSISHGLIALRSYNLIFKNKLTYTESKIHNISLADVIYGHILTLIFCAFIIYKLL